MQTPGAKRMCVTKKKTVNSVIVVVVVFIIIPFFVVIVAVLRARLFLSIDPTTNDIQIHVLRFTSSVLVRFAGPHQICSFRLYLFF